MAINSPPQRTVRIFNVTLACFAVALLLAIALALRVSTLKPPAGSVVLGSARLWRGHTACFRAAAVDADGNALPGTPITFTLRDERGGRSEAATVGHPFAEVNMQVPTDLAPDAWMDVAVSHSDEDTEIMHVPVQGIDSPGPVHAHISPWWQQLQKTLAPRVMQQPVQVALYPASGALVGGLRNRVVARVSQQGAAWSTDVAQSQLQLQAHSDAFGLLAFTWLPPPQVLPLKFAVGTAPSQSIEVPVESQARQLQLRVHPPAVLQPGEDLEGHVDALPFRGAIGVDLWLGEALVWGDSGEAQHGERDVRLHVPPAHRGWVVVNASRNPLAPQDTTSSSVRWAGDGAGAVAALASLGGDEPTVAALQQTHDEALRAALLPLALSRVVPDNVAVPVLLTTTENRSEDFAQSQEAMRTSIYRFMAGVFTVGAALAVLYVVQHTRRVRRAVQGVVDDGLAAGEELDPQLGAHVTRVEHAAYLFLSLVSLALAGYGMFTLIARMRWR